MAVPHAPKQQASSDLHSTSSTHCQGVLSPPTFGYLYQYVWGSSVAMPAQAGIQLVVFRPEPGCWSPGVSVPSTRARCPMNTLYLSQLDRSSGDDTHDGVELQALRSLQFSMVLEISGLGV